MRRISPVLTSTTLVAALMATAAVTGLAGTASAAPAKIKNDDPMNVIYLLGDGMGRTHVTAGRQRFYGAGGKMVMETLPAHGYVGTYAVERNSGQPGKAGFQPNLVTDSASAATAWSSGVKTYNSALGVDAKGTAVPTLMELAKQAGLRTGNVTTSEITDATPAGQMSHVLARGCQGPDYSRAACQDTRITGSELETTDKRVTPIADQIASSKTADVLFGGGLSRFDASNEIELRKNGYSVLGSIASQTVATEKDLRAAGGQKVFGLFNTGNLTVEKTKQDNPVAPEALEPSLSEMTDKAINLLSHKGSKGSKGDGFYLQVEGALIDKRSHANDPAQTLEEIKAFDDSVKVALDFARKDGNTMVIVTADHECAGFNVIEKDSFTNAEAATPPGNVDSGNPANNSAPTRARNKLDKLRSTGIVNGAGSADVGNFAPATFHTPDDPEGTKDGSPEASLWLSYLSGNHTGADVPLFAYGAGSEQLEGTIDNTKLFSIVGRALQVVH